MARVGVFVCFCGANIGDFVDVPAVVQEAKKIKEVKISIEYKYMCSDPGQGMIRDAIVQNRLTSVVVAACSPRMHEKTFRKALSDAGMNPYLLEVANIREHSSWVHQKDKKAATEKASDLIRMAVATSTIFGVRIHWEQSSVGKVSSSWAMRPPMDGLFSTRVTGIRASAMSSAAWIPAIPPPITRARLVTGTEISCSCSLAMDLAMAILIRSDAFSVAAFLSFW